MRGLLLSAILYLYCICICICTAGDVRVHKEQLEGKGWRDDSPSTCNSYHLPSNFLFINSPIRDFTKSHPLIHVGGCCLLQTLAY